MSDATTRSPREPWTDYAKQSPEERDRLLAEKFQQAKEHGEQDYALALTAAVANYELVLELQPDTQHAEEIAGKAHDLHDDAGSWSPELAAIPAARRSRGTKTDFRAADAPLPAAAPPDGVDLRRPWQPVLDQGHTTSCVGWAVAESLRWYLVEAGRLAPDQALSPRHIWMAAKETDQREDYPSTFLEEDGTSLKAGLDVVRKFGAALEAELPWEGGLVAGSPDDFHRSADGRRIVSYFNLGDDSVPDRSACFDDWRRWLAHSGPVVVLLQLDKNVAAARLEAFDEATADGSHAAALFGYGPDHFLLRSSWGTQWGDGGYARMSLAYAARAVIESYGVIV